MSERLATAVPETNQVLPARRRKSAATRRATASTITARKNSACIATHTWSMAGEPPGTQTGTATSGPY
jgi:hypothetical protein